MRPLIELFRLPGFSHGQMVIMRLLIALVVWRLWPGELNYIGQPSPVGLALLAEKWFGADLLWMTSPTAEGLTMVMLAGFLVVYVAGTAPIVSTLGVTVLLSLMGALENSQGFTTHHGQVVALAMLAQFMAHSWQRVSSWKRPALLALTPAERRLRENRAGLFGAQQAVVATYVISAITKYNASGFGWIADSKYFPLQILKAQQADYYSHLGDREPSAERLTAWLEQMMTSSTLATQILVGAALILEFGAILALLGRWWGIGISVALIAFHLTVSKVMNLTFRYNMSLLAILFILPPVMDWLACLGARLGALIGVKPGDVWRRIPAKVMLFGIAISYLTISGRGWEKVGHGFSSDRVRTAEVYPLSSFPMYSTFSDAPNLVYITDGEGEPLAIAREFGVVSSALKKIYDAELRVIRDEIGKSMRAMSEEERSPAGEETLRRLRDVLAPEAFADGRFPVLQLHEVRIRRGEDGFEYEDWTVGELHTPDPQEGAAEDEPSTNDSTATGEQDDDPVPDQ